MKTILINNVFVGGYGFEKGNLPHEMINFFKADDGNFYVYVTPYGIIDKNLKIQDLKAILFVRNAGNSKVEVLAKAEIGQEQTKSDFYVQGCELYGKGKNKWQVKENCKWTDKSQNIYYGEKSLKDIHRSNIWDNDIYVTMRVDKLCLPKKTFFLTHKEKTIAQTEDVYSIRESENEFKQLANQSMKAYFDSESTKKSYEKLEKIINDEQLWNDASETPKYDSKQIKDDCNFFKITRQQDNEVMFTNMLYYFFSEYQCLAKEFFKKYNIELSDNFVVEREKEHMDIRLIDDNTYIIVENKIKSSINGLKKDGDDYKKENGKYISQLSVYYKNAKEKNEKDKKTRNIKCFIFAPNYSAINEKYLENYSHGDKYDIVYYDEIYKFFNEYKKDSKNEVSNNMYIDEFLKAIKKHTEKVDNEFRNDLMLRLKERIEE